MQLSAMQTPATGGVPGYPTCQARAPDPLKFDTQGSGIFTVQFHYKGCIESRYGKVLNPELPCPSPWSQEHVTLLACHCV